MICLGNIAISFNTGAVAAAIPTISQDLGLPDFWVAKIIPSYMIPYGLGALLYAPLTRFAAYRTISMIAMALYAVFSLMTGLSHSLSSMLLAQVGAGVAAASSTPLSLMIIGDFFDKEVRGRLVGTYFGCSFIASLAGMIFMGVVDWRWLFFIPAVLGAATVICYLVLRPSLLDHGHQASINYFQILSSWRVQKVFIFIFIMSFLYHGVHKWYGVYLNREYGLDKFSISWFLVVVALCGLMGQQIGGFLSDKKGRLFACHMGMAMLSLATMALLGHYPIILLAVIISLIVMGWTIGHNSVSTILTDFPDDDRPLVASLNSAVRFISGGLGFTASKFFVEKSFNLTFFVIGAMMLAMIVLLKQIFVEHSTGG